MKLGEERSFEERRGNKRRGDVSTRGGNDKK